jgi:MFS family permease
MKGQYGWQWKNLMKSGIGNLSTVYKAPTLDSQNRLRWNFLMGMTYGAFFNGGLAFSDPSTVLPVFLGSFTDSKTLIGLSAAVMSTFGGIGSLLPQLFVASKLESKVSKRPLLRAAISVRAICWGLLALITYWFGLSHPVGIIVALLFLLTLFTFMGGIAVVPFYDIWAKAIPAHVRGRFFGYLQLLGGILAVGSGFVVKYILSHREIAFPTNYAVLFLFSFIFIGISYLALGSVKEPTGEVYTEKLPFREFLTKAFHILRYDDNYKLFVLVQIFGGALTLALPFYVVYAKDVLGITLGMVGIFLSAQMLGSVISNLLWGYLSDFVGNKKVIQTSICLGLMAPLIALVTPPHLTALFIPLFVLIGFSMTGQMIGNTNFLLDISPPKDRPTYISLRGTLRFPVMIFPLIGGVLVQNISYSFLFMVTILSVLYGFILTFRLHDPREGEPAMRMKS